MVVHRVLCQRRARRCEQRVDAIEWENKLFQLTETGKYPIDVGFIMEFELPRDRSEGNEFPFGLSIRRDARIARCQFQDASRIRVLTDNVQG